MHRSNGLLSKEYLNAHNLVQKYGIQELIISLAGLYEVPQESQYRPSSGSPVRLPFADAIRSRRGH